MLKFAKVMSVVMVLTALLGGITPATMAQSLPPAKTTPWVVSVTYQNVGNGPATIMVDFRAEGSATALPFNPLQGIGDGKLAAGAGASFYIGNVANVTEGFRGSAVMSADQPLVATVVQFSQTAGYKMRLLSNGFQASDASSQYLIATTLLNRFNRTTVFSIQNTENAPIIATVRFYDAANNGQLAATATHVIPANSSKYIDMSLTANTNLPAATTSFDGSAIITAAFQDGGAPAKVVAAASEYYTNRPVAANFEGVPLDRAADTIYLATGLCRSFGLDTYYAVQNASLTESAYIEVTYRNTSGGVVTTDGRYLLGPGGKKSITTCQPNSNAAAMVGFSGSAMIRSYSANTGTTPGAPIVAIGKAQTSIAAPQPNTLDAFTAFMSEPVGVSRIAVPFVRWASAANFITTKPGAQRAYIAVQNLEDRQIQVSVTYKDRNGNTVGTPQTLTIPAYSKQNSNPFDAGAVTAGGALGMNPGEFGYYTDGGFGGGAIIQAVTPGDKFIAIVRVNNNGASEDYNGPPAP